MTLNGVMAVIFCVILLNLVNTCVPAHNRRVDLWRNLCTSLLYVVVRVRCRRTESSRSLTHLLMSFLLVFLNHDGVIKSKKKRSWPYLADSEEAEAGPCPALLTALTLNSYDEPSLMSLNVNVLSFTLSLFTIHFPTFSRTC